MAPGRVLQPDSCGFPEFRGITARGDLTALSRPIPLDPQVKASFVRVIEQERTRNDALTRISLELMQWIRRTHYLPDNSGRQRWLEHSPTIAFCRRHGFTVPAIQTK